MKNYKSLSVLPLFVGALLLLSSTTWGKKSVTSPSGSLRNTQYSDLKDHPSKSKTYNEFWTYQFLLNNNMTVHFNYSRANLGRIKDPVCGTDLSIINFKKKTYTLAREYPKSNFQFTDSEERLNIHKNIWFSGKLPESHRVFLHTTKKGIEYLVDLSFTDIQVGKTWGDGIFKLGSEKIGIYVHIPRAKVKGFIAINGDSLAVEGTAYMDHTFQTKMGTKLVKNGYRYMSTTGPIELGYILQPQKKYSQKPVGFGLQEVEGKLQLLTPTAIKINKQAKAKKLKVATDLSLVYKESTVNLKRSRDNQQLSILNEFSGMTKWAVKRFMGGEVIYFRGQGMLNEKKMAYNFFGLK